MMVRTYEDGQRLLHFLIQQYPFINHEVAGQSVLGRNLDVVRLGIGKHQLFINAAHHGLEGQTAAIAFLFMAMYAQSYCSGRILCGYDVQKLWKDVSVFVMPMVNPDGVDLAVNGLHQTHPYYHYIERWREGEEVTQVWQANAKGVDLNHNYDALWTRSKDAEIVHGIKQPGPTRYGGTAPECAPESKAVADYTRAHDFDMVLALHSQGEEIYWQFQDMEPPNAYDIGLKLAQASGYTLAQTTGIASYAGYKDWFIKQYKRPGFTIEIGKGKNPLPMSQLKGNFQKVLPLLMTAIDIAKG